MSRFRRPPFGLFEGSFARAVATVAGGTGAGQLIVILASPVLTRLYGPADYGVFAIGIAVLSLLLTITSLRYDYAIPLPDDDATGANLLALAVIISACLTLVAAVVLSIAGPTFLALFGASSLSPYILVICLAQFGGALANALANWAIRVKSFSSLAAMRLVQGATVTLMQVILGVLRLGPIGLLLGDAIGRLASAIWIARGAWRSHRTAFKGVTTRGILAAARRYRRFPIFSTGSALLATGGLQAPLLLLASAFGTSTSGQYALAARLCALPLALVANAVGQVFIGEAARLTTADPAALRSLYRRTTLALVRVAIGPAVIGMIAAPILAEPVFGEGWGMAGLFVAILIPSYLVEFVAGATGDLLYVLERQDLHLAREIMRLAFVGGAVPLAAALGFTPVEAVVLLSIAGCFTYLAYGWITWRAVVSHADRIGRRPAPSI